MQSFLFWNYNTGGATFQWWNFLMRCLSCHLYIQWNLFYLTLMCRTWQGVGLYWEKNVCRSRKGVGLHSAKTEKKVQRRIKINVEYIFGSIGGCLTTMLSQTVIFRLAGKIRRLPLWVCRVVVGVVGNTSLLACWHRPNIDPTLKFQRLKYCWSNVGTTTTHQRWFLSSGANDGPTHACLL